jgi:hypothetical protein
MPQGVQHPAQHAQPRDVADYVRLTATGVGLSGFRACS